MDSWMAGQGPSDVEYRLQVQGRAERRHVDVTGGHETKYRAAGPDGIAYPPDLLEQIQIRQDRGRFRL